MDTLFYIAALIAKVKEAEAKVTALGGGVQHRAASSRSSTDGRVRNFRTGLPPGALSTLCCPYLIFTPLFVVLSIIQAKMSAAEMTAAETKRLSAAATDFVPGTPKIYSLAPHPIIDSLFYLFFPCCRRAFFPAPPGQ